MAHPHVVAVALGLALLAPGCASVPTVVSPSGLRVSIERVRHAGNLALVVFTLANHSGEPVVLAGGGVSLDSAGERAVGDVATPTLRLRMSAIELVDGQETRLQLAFEFGHDVQPDRLQLIIDGLRRGRADAAGQALPPLVVPLPTE